MTDFYFILFLKRLYADEKLQYFQLSYIPCHMVQLYSPFDQPKTGLKN